MKKFSSLSQDSPHANEKDRQREQRESEIIRILDEQARDENSLLHRIENLDWEEQVDYKANIIKILSHLEFSRSEADRIWEEILAHQKSLEKRLDRLVGFRVAMMDYFININRHIINPKIIEIKLYMETERLAIRDELTGLYNRRFFNETLKMFCHNAARQKISFSLLVLDVDDFKMVNDGFGHQEGDKVLQSLSAVLEANVRSGDFVCRIGGEEFAVLMPDTALQGAHVVAEKLRREFENVKVNSRPMSLSAGIAVYPDDGSEPDLLFENADAFLYRSKAAGKNRVSSSLNDNRSFYRQDVNWEIIHKKSGEMERVPALVAKAVDFSFGGIAFETNIPYEVGSVVEVELSKGPGSTIPLRLRIRWIKDLGQEKRAGLLPNADDPNSAGQLPPTLEPAMAIPENNSENEVSLRYRVGARIEDIY